MQRKFALSQLVFHNTSRKTPASLPSKTLRLDLLSYPIFIKKIAKSFGKMASRSFNAEVLLRLEVDNSDFPDSESSGEE